MPDKAGPPPMPGKPGPPPMPKSEPPELSVEPPESSATPPPITHKHDEIMGRLLQALTIFLVGVGVFVFAGLIVVQAILIVLPILIMIGIWVIYLGWELTNSLPKGPHNSLTLQSLASPHGKLARFVKGIGALPILLAVFGPIVLAKTPSSGFPGFARFLIVVFAVIAIPLTVLAYTKTKQLIERGA